MKKTAKSGKPKKKSRTTKRPSLNIRQSRFARAFMTSRSATEAAIIAGYPPKTAGQAGHAVLKSLAKKAPEVMDQLGLSLPTLIENHLKPLLNARQTKFAQEDGEFTDYVEVEDNDVRERALDKAFRLHGAYAPRDPELAAQVGVKVVIVDVPRPNRSVILADVGPGPLPESKE